MIVKELLEQRWKLVGGLLVSLMMVLGLIAVIERFQSEMFRDVQGQGLTVQLHGSYAEAMWQVVYSPLSNNGPVLLFLAALLGGTLIAGEVSRGTIHTLLSRPLGRRQVLLSKYGVAAGMLLAVVLSGTLGMLGLTAVLGHPQPVAGALLSALLFCLGGLFVLGLSATFSVLFSDVLRPVVLTLLVVVLLTLLPSALRLPPVWNLLSSWSSLDAYRGTSFPLRELLVSAVAAVVPLLLALGLFRTRQY